MEKSFARAHFKSKYSRALDGSNQRKKQSSSQYFRLRRAVLK